MSTKIRLEIDLEVVKMIIGVLRHIDPTGFMFNKIVEQIVTVVNQQMPKTEQPEEVQFKEKKKE